MPKSVNLHNNLRIDIPDFERAANTYTSETMNFLVAHGILDYKSKVFSGFRLEIDDQTSFPGQITLRNGVAFDLDGQIINIEDQPDASLTTTLVGANQTFYVEIRFTETESDVDGRGFWDSTIENVSPEVDGAEINLNVSTRKTPSWEIVAPVSTTGFTADSSPDSVIIPVGILSTDGSGEITSAVNQFASLVTASTVTLADGAISDTTLQVAESTLIPAGSTISVDFGDATVETGITVTANNMERGVLTISPALTSAHLAGAIIRVTGVTSTFIAEEPNPNSADYSEVSPADQPNDWRQRMWGGDEIRGSGLMKSKETYGSRDDLDTKNVKDMYDLVSSILREMKFGNPRSDATSTAPPSSFPTVPRYFDNAGSIQGARNYTVSIGNGTTTFGDFNGTDETPFIAAVADIESRGGGTIFLKAGTYTFANPVALTSAGYPIQIIGSWGNLTEIRNNNASTIGAFQLPDAGSVEHRFENINGVNIGLADIFIEVTGTPGTVYFTNCTIPGISSSSANGVLIEAVNTTFQDSFAPTTFINNSYFKNTTFSTAVAPTTGLFRTTFEDCTLADGISTTSISNTKIIRSSIDSTTGVNCINTSGTMATSFIRDCVFESVDASVLSFTGAVTDVTFAGCTIEVTGGVALFDEAVYFGSTATDVTFDNCNIINGSDASVGAGSVGGILFVGAATDVRIDKTSIDISGSLNTASGFTMTGMQFDTSAVNTRVTNCVFTLGDDSYTEGFNLAGTAENSLLILGCSFTNGFRWGTWGNSTGSISISDCTFSTPTTLECSGLYTSGTGGLIKAHIRGCVFTGSQDIGLAGDHSAISLNARTETELVVSDCTFENFGINFNGSNKKGIYATGLNSGNIRITSNIFRDFGTTAAGTVAAIDIFTNNLVGIPNSVTITNNDFTNFVGAASTTLALINVLATGTAATSPDSRVVVSNNNFDNITINLTDDNTKLIRVDDASELHICGNVATDTQEGLCEILSTLEFMRSFSVNNNTVNISGSGVAKTVVLANTLAVNVVNSASVCNNSFIVFSNTSLAMLNISQPMQLSVIGNHFISDVDPLITCSTLASSLGCTYSNNIHQWGTFGGASTTVVIIVAGVSAAVNGNEFPYLGGGTKLDVTSVAYASLTGNTNIIGNTTLSAAQSPTITGTSGLSLDDLNS